jgi:YVTN family beta-propeller protein
MFRRTALAVSLALVVGAAAPVFATSQATQQRRPLLFVPSFDSNVVSVFDLRNGKLIKSIGLQARGACCVYSTPDQRTVYVVGGLSPYVTAMDTKSLRVTRVIRIPGLSGDHGSVLSRDGRTFWVDNLPQGDIVGIDTHTNTVRKVFKGAGGVFQNSRDGRWLFQDNGHGVFTVRDATTGNLVAQTALPHSGSAQAVQVAPGGRTAYVIGAAPVAAPFSEGGTVRKSFVEVVDIRAPLHPRYVTSVATGPFPEIGTFTPDARQLWVPNSGDGTISVIDLATNRVVHTIATGRYITYVNFLGNRAYITQSPSKVPPTYASAMLLTAAAVVPGAAVTPKSGSSKHRPGIDPPGEIATYNRLTYKPLGLPTMPLPSEAFVSDVVMAPM